jgi:hypothetical protein
MISETLEHQYTQRGKNRVCDDITIPNSRFFIYKSTPKEKVTHKSFVWLASNLSHQSQDIK